MRRNRLIALTLFSLAAAAAIVPLACGGDDPGPGSVCGNGVTESGEECDLGANNGQEGYGCSAACKKLNLSRSRLNVTWSILKNTNVEGFDGSTCGPIQADKAQILVVGPNNLRIEQTIDCTKYGTIISGWCVRPDGGTVDDCTQRLPMGDYRATVTLIRGSDSTAVTEAVNSASRQNAQHGSDLNLTIDFGFDNLLNKGTLKGSLLLDLAWGENGKKCDTATPAVTQEAFKLTVGSSGKLATGMSKSGTRLDGTPSYCVIPGKMPDQNRQNEEIPDLAIGPYTLLIQGYPGAGPPLYCKRLEVFVGPGSNTQPFHIVVPAVVSSDAGTCN